MSNDLDIARFSGKRYYGYAIHLSKNKLDEYREEQGIAHDDFTEILITFKDEGTTIRMSYREFKKRLNISEARESFVMINKGESPTCLHSNCEDCKGSGVKQDGAMCIHSISCQCDKHREARLRK